MWSFFINWNVDPVLFDIGGITLRYYSLLFVVAFALGYKVEEKIFHAEGIGQLWLDKLLIYVVIATVIGARLGHCFFYDWAYFSQHPLEIILPVRFQPTFKFTGYQGLASHGAAIGIIAALWFYSRKVSKRSVFWILDRVVLPIALAGFFIRIGNLMNSEIIGEPTIVPWGFQFVRADVADPLTPRHPAQLYEAVCYLISFMVLMQLYWRTKVKERLGFLFGMFLILIFSARFFVEFVKEPQEPWEAEMTLNMGQWLSIPFVLLGFFMLWYSKSHRLPVVQNNTTRPGNQKKK